MKRKCLKRNATGKRNGQIRPKIQKNVERIKSGDKPIGNFQEFVTIILFHAS